MGSFTMFPSPCAHWSQIVSTQTPVLPEVQSRGGARQPTASRWKELAWRLPVLASLAVIIAWQSFAQREFWSAAWQQATLLPIIVGDCECSACLDSSATVEVAWQQPSISSFDLRGLTIPVRQVMSGGVEKDGIPAITDPKWVSAQAATYLKPQDRVIGLVQGKEARAYPLRIVEQHEVVNDRLGGLPVAVTYCPLCDSAAAFDRRSDGRELEFGVSGLLYNSNVLMYDRGGQPESLWSQLMASGVSGPAARQPLKAVPIELTTWKNWKERYPATSVLSAETGFQRDYSSSPYEAYYRSGRLMFPANPKSDRLPAKRPVLGVWSEKSARAFPLSAFGRESKSLEQEIDGRKFTVIFDADAGSLRVADADAGVNWMYSYWFAWYAFRPKTEVFKSLAVTDTFK